MSSQSGNIKYLGLYGRNQPPLIAVHYQNKNDTKKRAYTILLQRLVLHPNPMEVAEQLYIEHPHILKQGKVSKQKVANIIEKIQRKLKIIDGQSDEEQEYGEQEYGEQEYDDQQHHQQEPEQQQVKPVVQVPKKRSKYDFDKEFGRDDGPLNRSS